MSQSSKSIASPYKWCFFILNHQNLTDTFRALQMDFACKI